MKMNPYNMPQIIKETSDGYFHLSVLDDLLSQREIYCLGEIDADSAGSLILQLQYLAAQDPEAEITLYISALSNVTKIRSGIIRQECSWQH